MRIITDDELAEIETAYDASTKGNWRRSRKVLASIGETVGWLGRMAGYHHEQPNLELLCAMVDASDPPDVLENIEEYYCPAVTGNGPTSGANAAFIEVAHNYMPLLLAEIRRLRHSGYAAGRAEMQRECAAQICLHCEEVGTGRGHFIVEPAENEVDGWFHRMSAPGDLDDGQPQECTAGAVWALTP